MRRSRPTFSSGYGRTSTGCWRTCTLSKSDLWRLLVMCREGGLYMDIDRLVNMPMSRLLGKHTKMLLPLFRGFGSANAAGRVVSRWTTSSPFGLTQDLMVSAAGNPLHCEAAALNVAEHAACRDPLRQLWGDCTIIKLGPELFMHSALLSLFGEEGEAIWRAVRAHNGHATRRFVIHALQTLQPYAFARDEILPVDTLLFDAQGPRIVHGHESGSSGRSNSSTHARA